MTPTDTQFCNLTPNVREAARADWLVVTDQLPVANSQLTHAIRPPATHAMTLEQRAAVCATGPDGDRRLPQSDGLPCRDRLVITDRFRGPKPQLTVAIAPPAAHRTVGKQGTHMLSSGGKRTGHSRSSPRT